MSLSETWDDPEFPDEAVSRIAATFDSTAAQLVASGDATEKQERDLVTLWYNIAKSYGIDDHERMAALTIQGMALYYDEAKETAIGHMIDHFEDG